MVPCNSSQDYKHCSAAAAELKGWAQQPFGPQLNGPSKYKYTQYIRVFDPDSRVYAQEYTSHSQMLGKFEYGGGPIFKVVIEC